MTKAPLFAAWLDRFFEAYYRDHPVNATFIGRHEHDHRLPDASGSGIAAESESVSRLRRELDTLPPEKLSPAEAIDRDLARGFLEIEHRELESCHFQRGNPAWYTGEAIFGIFSLLLRNFAPREERLESVRARLEALPRFLEAGRANLTRAPRPWVERAMDECRGALAFLSEHGLEFAPDRAVSNAANAFEGFLSHLTEIPDSDDYAYGREGFEELLLSGHFLDESAEDILGRAEREVVRCEEALARGASDWRSELTRLKEIHPSRESYDARFRQCWVECRALAESEKLITWPDYPIDYVPQPVWAREAAPYLYFLFYRSPAPFDELPVVDYLVTPLEPELTEEQALEVLRATNESVIKMNHVVHHGAIGHHLQNWHAQRAPSRIGQIAAVDGSARIAMLSGGTMAEGWASYATDLMDEVGFFTELESYSQHHAHLRMAARAIVDIRIHSGDMTFEEAARFYTERTNMTARVARSEVTKNTMFPGAALIYFVGAGLIHDLRAAMRSKLGDDFDLRAFHDRFLSYGSIPVSLIRKHMLGGRHEEQS